MPQREKEMILKDKNFLTSITDLCKSENNLNLLSSKISSILNCNLKEMNKKMLNENLNEMMDDDENGYQSNDYTESINASEIEAKLLIGKGIRGLIHQKRDEEGILNESISGNDTNDMEMEDDEDEDESDRNSFKTPINRRALMDEPPLSNPRFKDFLLQTNPNLVISKGSKKWISDSVGHLNDIADNDTNLMTQANRDFLAKLISTKLQKGTNQSRIDETSEHSPVLDVDSNLQHQQQENNQFNQIYNHQTTMIQNNNSNMMDIQFHNNNSNQNNFNSHFNHLGSFYNGNTNSNRNLSGAIPTSASLLVEAALNSVSNMIGNGDLSDSENNQQMALESDENHQQGGLPVVGMTNQEFQSSHGIMPSVDDMKILKSQNFPIHLPSMASFNNSVNTSMISENNEIEVDTSSTPKSHEKLCSFTPSGEKEVNSFQNQTNDSCSPARTMTPDQQNSNYNVNFTNQRNTQATQMQTSPAGQLTSRPMYGSEHDLISPASTPSLPRYDFGAENYRRREKNLSTTSNYQKSMHHHQPMQQHATNIAHISSDEENSIAIAENLSINQQNQSHLANDKIKLNSQIDLIYANNSKYDHSANQSNNIHRESLTDLRLKYNEQGLEIQEFSRNSIVNENVLSNGNGSDYQGIDMTSRGGIGYHSHSFPLSSSTGSNLSFNRYQHHIYDILTDREQQAQQSQQQQEHHPFQIQQQQQQQIQHLLQEHISHDQDSEQIQSGVDLSRTSNTYIVPPSSPHLPYSHTHSEMLRMASLDLSSGGGGTPSMVSQVCTNIEWISLDYLLLSSTESLLNVPVQFFITKRSTSACFLDVS